MKNVKTETIVRTGVLIFALINQALTASGRNILPVSDEQVAEIISLTITIGASVWAWWKNNSFTKNAIEADKVLEKLKSEEA
jgi:SPP1 family holin